MLLLPALDKVGSTNTINIHSHLCITLGQFTKHYLYQYCHSIVHSYFMGLGWVLVYFVLFVCLLVLWVWGFWLLGFDLVCLLSPKYRVQFLSHKEFTATIGTLFPYTIRCSVPTQSTSQRLLHRRQLVLYSRNYPSPISQADRRVLSKAPRI